MAGQYEPGAVAMIGNAPAMRIDTGDDTYWVSPIGTKWRDVIPQRPLVLIDPEDDKQVERLASAFCHARWDHTGGGDECDPLTFSSMATALREYAQPKPEEPTGLGAVVEDADGDRWVLYTNPRNDAPWCNGSASVDYDDIAAVRVLSEGVTS